MRFVVYGAGAVGGVVAARLAQAGRNVVAVARGSHLEAIRENGLTVVANGRRERVALEVAGDADALGLRDGDVVLLAVKGQDTRAALESLTGFDVPIVCLQNGVANERAALRRFRRVYGAYVFAPVTYLEPGIVEAEFAPVEGIIDVGRYPFGVDEIARATAEAIDATTFSARAIGDVMRWKHAKLLGNLANAVQALCVPGEPALLLAERAREEGRAVLAAAGIDYASEDEQAARRAGIARRAGGGRAGGSTWQSLARGAGSVETDYLNGEVVLLGRLHGVATPVNEILQRHAALAVRESAPPGHLSASDLLREAGFA